MNKTWRQDICIKNIPTKHLDNYMQTKYSRRNDINTVQTGKMYGLE